MINPTYLEYIILVIPLIVGYAASSICKMDQSAGENVKLRPPPWVFAVVWPILYILIGISWAVAHRYNPMNSIAYILLNSMLVLWLVSYSCAGNKSFAIYVLLEAIAATFACMYLGNTMSRILLIPLAIWLFFATYLNAAETADLEK